MLQVSKYCLEEDEIPQCFVRFFRGFGLFGTVLEGRILGSSSPVQKHVSMPPCKEVWNGSCMWPPPHHSKN
jgi:hypothetical protein